MKIVSSIIILILLVGCQMGKNKIGQKNNNYPFYVGTYTDKESEGIYKYILNKDGSLERIGLVAITENPAFLTISNDKKYLLAVNEIDSNGVGFVESFQIKNKSLEFISNSSSGGAHPCFITINKMGFVLVANYTGGNVGLLKLDKEGVLSPLLDVEDHFETEIHEDQQIPHAHSAWFESSSNAVISVDKGIDELWFSQLNTELEKLIPSDPKKLRMELGAGPRHLAFHPNGQWIYVLNELNSTITLVHKLDDDNYEKGVSVSTLPMDYNEWSICADIHISSDGKFLYASNRGHNSIAIFKVEPNTGSLNLVGHQSTQGDFPRNFALSPDEKYLLVANRHSNNIVSFKRDKSTGLLKMVDQIEVPTPACIVF